MQINLFKATLSLRAGARLGCGLLRKLNRWNKRKRESRQTLLQQTPPPSSSLSLTIFSREKIKHNKTSLSVILQMFLNSFFTQIDIFFYWVNQKCYTAIFFPIDGSQSSGLLSSLLSFPAWLAEAGARIFFSFFSRSKEKFYFHFYSRKYFFF